MEIVEQAEVTVTDRQAACEFGILSLVTADGRTFAVKELAPALAGIAIGDTGVAWHNGDRWHFSSWGDACEMREPLPFDPKRDGFPDGV